MVSSEDDSDDGSDDLGIPPSWRVQNCNGRREKMVSSEDDSDDGSDDQLAAGAAQVSPSTSSASKRARLAPVPSSGEGSNSGASGSEARAVEAAAESEAKEDESEGEGEGTSDEDEAAEGESGEAEDENEDESEGEGEGEAEGEGPKYSPETRKVLDKHERRKSKLVALEDVKAKADQFIYAAIGRGISIGRRHQQHRKGIRGSTTTASCWASRALARPRSSRSCCTSPLRTSAF